MTKGHCEGQTEGISLCNDVSWCSVLYSKEQHAAHLNHVCHFDKRSGPKSYPTNGISIKTAHEAGCIMKECIFQNWQQHHYVQPSLSHAASLEVVPTDRACTVGTVPPHCGPLFMTVARWTTLHVGFTSQYD